MINDVTESSILISWNAPVLGGGANTITGYLVTVSPDESHSSNVQETTVDITGLTSNTEYTVNVSAVGSDGRNGSALVTTATTSTVISGG